MSWVTGEHAEGHLLCQSVEERSLLALPVAVDLTGNGVHLVVQGGQQDALKGLICGTAPQSSNFE